MAEFTCATIISIFIPLLTTYRQLPNCISSAYSLETTTNTHRNALVYISISYKDSVISLSIVRYVASSG